MSVNAISQSLIYKSVHRFRSDDAYKNATQGFLMQAEERLHEGKSVSSAPKVRTSQDSSAHAGINQNSSVNKSIKTTAVNDYSGRLSFKGNVAAEAAKAAPEIGGRWMQAIAKHPWTIKFVEKVDKNMLLFEAAFALFVTCGLRPAAILVIPSDDKEKNKKAASHSIASGIISYAFVLLLSTPVKKGIDKMVKNANKYVPKAGQDFMKLGKNEGTLKALYQKMAEFAYTPLRAMLSIALIPLVDKHVIDKIIPPSKSKKNSNQLPSINETAFKVFFRGNNQSPTVAFKEFREGRSKLS